MRYLYVQDTHIRGVNPSSRKGDYYQDIMNKISEVVSLSKRLKVDCVLHGGDVFDSAVVSNTIVDDFVDRIEEAKISWYILPGNHDEIGHNWDNSKASSLAHIFRRSKKIEELTILPDVKKFKTVIKGFRYFHNIEKDIKDNGLQSPSKNAEFKLAIVHALITLKPLPYQAMHVIVKDIKTNFDIILVAHNHQPFGIKEINGTKFVNIGSLGRRKIDEANIKPSILYIDTDKKELKIIELKSAKVKEEVFDLDRIEKAKEFNGDIELFVKSLKETEVSGLDLRGIVEHIASQRDIDRSIVDEAVERIGKYEL